MEGDIRAILLLIKINFNFNMIEMKVECGGHISDPW
jgi:hypothetical protein